jgi:hypothetical protein
MTGALLALLALGSASAQDTLPRATAEPRPSESEAYARLFAEGAEESAPAPSEPVLPGWIYPAALGFFGLWAATRLRAPQGGDVPTAAMSVVSRTPLGDRSHLLVVDVTGADGERRRLLIGTGTGAPSLVADLGALTPTPLLSGPTRPERGTFLEALDAIGVEAQERREAARLDPSDIVGPAAEDEFPRARPRGVAAFAANAAEPRRRTREDAAAHARNLVDEVLAERGSSPGSGPRKPGAA